MPRVENELQLRELILDYFLLTDNGRETRAGGSRAIGNHINPDCLPENLETVKQLIASVDCILVKLGITDADKVALIQAYKELVSNKSGATSTASVDERVPDLTKRLSAQLNSNSLPQLTFSKQDIQLILMPYIAACTPLFQCLSKNKSCLPAARIEQAVLYNDFVTYFETNRQQLFMIMHPSLWPTVILPKLGPALGFVENQSAMLRDLSLVLYHLFVYSQPKVDSSESGAIKASKIATEFWEYLQGYVRDNPSCVDTQRLVKNASLQLALISGEYDELCTYIQLFTTSGMPDSTAILKASDWVGQVDVAAMGLPVDQMLAREKVLSLREELIRGFNTSSVLVRIVKKLIKGNFTRLYNSHQAIPLIFPYLLRVYFDKPVVVHHFKRIHLRTLVSRYLYEGSIRLNKSRFVLLMNYLSNHYERTCSHSGEQLMQSNCDLLMEILAQDAGMSLGIHDEELDCIRAADPVGRAIRAYVVARVSALRGEEVIPSDALRTQDGLEDWFKAQVQWVSGGDEAGVILSESESESEPESEPGSEERVSPPEQCYQARVLNSVNKVICLLLKLSDYVDMPSEVTRIRAQLESCYDEVAKEVVEDIVYRRKGAKLPDSRKEERRQIKDAAEEDANELIAFSLENQLFSGFVKKYAKQEEKKLRAKEAEAAGIGAAAGAGGAGAVAGTAVGIGAALGTTLGPVGTVVGAAIGGGVAAVTAASAGIGAAVQARKGRSVLALVQRLQTLTLPDARRRLSSISMMRPAGGGGSKSTPLLPKAVIEMTSS